MFVVFICMEYLKNVVYNVTLIVIFEMIIVFFCTRI